MIEKLVKLMLTNYIIINYIVFTNRGWTNSRTTTRTKCVLCAWAHCLCTRSSSPSATKQNRSELPREYGGSPSDARTSFLRNPDVLQVNHQLFGDIDTFTTEYLLINVSNFYTIYTVRN